MLKNLRRERTALSANLLTASGTLARVVCGVGKTKLTAVFLGPAGLGLVGVAGQVQQLGITWGSLALGAGFSQEYAAALASGCEPVRKKLLATTFTSLLVASTLIVLVFCFAATSLNGYFFGSSGKTAFLLALAAALPFQVMIGTYFQGILYAHGMLSQWSRANTAGALAELGLSATGMLAGGVAGALWGIAGGAAIWFLVLLNYVVQVERPRNLCSLSINGAFLRKLASSGVCSLATSTAAYGSGIFLRAHLLRNLGSEWAGAFHAATLISALYTQFLLNGIWAHLFPIASAGGAEDRVRNVVTTSLCVTAGLALAVEIALLSFPARLITIIFHGGFSHALFFLCAQLGGDYFFLVAQPFLALLLARRHLWVYGALWCSYYAVVTAGVSVHWQASPAAVYALAYGGGSLALALAAASASGLLKSIVGRVKIGGLGACLLAYASIFDTPAFLVVRSLLSCALAYLALKLVFEDAALEKVMMLKTRVLNIFRRLGMLPAIERKLAQTSEWARRPRWVRRIFPNHYQYPLPSVRLAERAGLRYELNIGNFLDWHVYFGVSEGCKGALYRLAKPGARVIDVGANIGETAMQLARRVGSSGEVVAFEPDPRMFEVASRNISLNSLPSLRLEKLALSDESGDVLIDCPTERNPGGNRIRSSRFSGNGSRARSERLETYWGDRSVDLIKIDVEGFELRVLKGAEKVLRAHRPMLFVELSDENLREQGTCAREVLEYLASLGYESKRADDGKQLNPSDSYVGVHCDIICSARSI